MIQGHKLRNKKLIDAIEHANRIFATERFYWEIKKKTFDKATASGEYIAHKIVEFRESTRVFVVKEYRSRFPSRVNAYVLNSDPNTLHINTRNLGRPLTSVVATVVHEAIHSVDNYDREHSYGHGDNRAAGKANCAPNWIGNHAKKFVNFKVSDSITHVLKESDAEGFNEIPHVAHFGKIREFFHKAILS